MKDHKDWAEQYAKGLSCGQVAKMFCVTRQSVWAWLETNGYETRKKIQLPFIIYDGKKFTANRSGYYRLTRRDKHISLHRYVWEKQKGKIPTGWDVHHINGNKQDNRISNLECLPKAEHTRKYSPHCNGAKHNCYEHTRKT
jgi:uncharacterized protein YbdZ (MbtH family)